MDEDYATTNMKHDSYKEIHGLVTSLEAKLQTKYIVVLNKPDLKVNATYQS